MELLQQPGSGSVVLSLLGGLLLFGLVLLAAWFCTRWLGGYYRSRGATGGSIQVLERAAIGPDRTLMIVRTGGGDGCPGAGSGGGAPAGPGGAH